MADCGAVPVDIKKLRPAKIRSALRRRWFERRVARLPLDPIAGLIDVGSAYGGWTVPLDLIDDSWLCYCIGIGGDISFELELIARHAVTVRSIDPVEEYVHAARLAAQEQPRLSVHHAAIATVDGPIRMQRTHDSSSRSVSAAGLYDSHDYLEVPGRTLQSLMADFGDQRIDLLKLDIEGIEYDVIPTLDLQALGVRVFATQLHHTGSVGDARRLIDGLARQGYRAVACRPVLKITFVRDL